MKNNLIKLAAVAFVVLGMVSSAYATEATKVDAKAKHKHAKHFGKPAPTAPAVKS